jgi:aminoglycoside phosphotransferase (APT) family kinase protein
MDLATCRQALRAHAPALELKTLELLGRGWDSESYLVDGRLVARFALTPEALGAFRMEQALLPIVAPAVAPVIVPEVELIWPGSSADPQAFALFTRIEGCPPAAPRAPVDRDALATELTGLIHRLHAVPIAALSDVPFDPPNTPWPERLEGFAVLVRRLVWPRLDPARQRRATELLTAVAGAIAEGPIALALLHGDLTTDNLRVDAGGRLTGLLDFGDALIGDPAFELRTLLSELDLDLARAVVNAYDDSLWSRVVLYARLLPLEHVVFGLTHDDEDVVTNGLAAFYDDRFARL